MDNKIIICIDCGNEFEFTSKDQEFYRVHGYKDPKRCDKCRATKKAHYKKLEESKMNSIDKPVDYR